MNTEVDQLKKSFSKAVLWILLLLAAATGTTYAWFTLTGINSTNVTPMAGTVSKGDTVLLISTSESGPFDKTCDLVLNGKSGTFLQIDCSEQEWNCSTLQQCRQQSRSGCSAWNGLSAMPECTM